MWCHWTGIRSCHGTSTWVTLVKVMRTKGTPDYDRMFGLKPLMDAIRLACQGFFHPGQNHSIDERMVETKAQHSMKKFIQSKPTKWGHRLFVLADSSDGYTASHSLPVTFPDKTIIQQLWLSSVCRQLLHFWRPPPAKKTVSTYLCRPLTNLKWTRWPRTDVCTAGRPGRSISPLPGNVRIVMLPSVS